jgi:hypothetical protein
MKHADRVESSERVSRVIQIPDPKLNEQLIPMNDNSRLPILSDEDLEARSILGQPDYIEPRGWTGLIVTAVIAFGFAVFAVFVAFLLK